MHIIKKNFSEIGVSNQYSIQFAEHELLDHLKLIKHTTGRYAQPSEISKTWRLDGAFTAQELISMAAYLLAAEVAQNTVSEPGLTS